eukprot:s1560_g6.t1
MELTLDYLKEIGLASFGEAPSFSDAASEVSDDSMSDISPIKEGCEIFSKQDNLPVDFESMPELHVDILEEAPEMTPGLKEALASGKINLTEEQEPKSMSEFDDSLKVGEIALETQPTQAYLFKLYVGAAEIAEKKAPTLLTSSPHIVTLKDSGDARAAEAGRQAQAERPRNAARHLNREEIICWLHGERPIREPRPQTS